MEQADSKAREVLKQAYLKPFIMPLNLRIILFEKMGIKLFPIVPKE